MWDALDITEEDAQGLAEIARHDLELARDFARRALACEDNAEAGGLMRDYQRAARSYRQTLAVKTRLKRDLAAAARMQATTPRPRPGGVAVARRIGELRTALLRVAWDEAERTEAEAAELGEEAVAFADAAETLAWYCREIEGNIAEDRRKDAFADEPLDDHVARMALDLGFKPDESARWRDLPDPPQAALDAEVDDDWLSSA